MRSFNGDFPPWRCSVRQRRRGEAQIEKKIEQYGRYSNKGRKKMVMKSGD